jgi:hypothetical protein
MRPLYLLQIALALCLGACHSPGQADKKDSTLLTSTSNGHSVDSVNPRDPSVEGNDSINLVNLKAKFEDAPIPFAGLWVSEPYVNGVRQGKPLRELQGSETSCIVIPARTLQHTIWIYGFHEGGGGVVFVKKGDDYFTYTLYNGKCADTLQTLADGRLRIGHSNYIRIGEKDSTVYDMGVLEQLLFAGRYLRSNAGDTAVFSKNGKIEGLDSLGWYEPVIDYIGDPTSVDRIRVGRDKKHLNDYAFRIVGDTLMIYAIDCLQYADKDCVSDTLGRRMYALPKLK